MSNNKNKLYCEMIEKQLDDVDEDLRLKPSDISRICKYIDSSIFDPNQCCIWKGYIANSENSSKGTYVNFYFNKNKVILHRLLYCNFIGELDDDEYIKFTCDNKGICCNVNHYKKNKYSISKNKKKKKNNEIDVVMMSGNITVDFD